MENESVAVTRRGNQHQHRARARPVMAAHRCYQRKLEEKMIKAEQSAIPHWVGIFRIVQWEHVQKG